MIKEPYPQFFTATILEWKHLLKPEKYKDIILNSIRFLVKENRIKIYGFVIMPNHIHLIWMINENHKRENVQRDFLRFTAQTIKFDLQENHPEVLERFQVNAKDRQYQFWERNPRCTDIYSTKVLEQKLQYLHLNPLQEHWQLTKDPEDYFYSSASFYFTESKEFDFITHYKNDF
jgi:putative transposase